MSTGNCPGVRWVLGAGVTVSTFVRKSPTTYTAVWASVGVAVVRSVTRRVLA